MTVLYPEKFKQSPAAGFDGLFEWDFLKGIFPRGIMPMDFDGVVELGGNFIVFETKSIDKEVPDGQRYTLERLVETGYWTVVILWGKDKPVEWERITRKRHYAKEGCDAETVCEFARKWAEWAEGKGKKR